MVVRNTTRRDAHRRIIAKGKPPCYHCGEEIDYHADWLHPLAYQVDHLTPLNKGGEDVVTNCVPSHRKCNREKSDKLPEVAGVTFSTTRAWT